MCSLVTRSGVAGAGAAAMELVRWMGQKVSGPHTISCRHRNDAFMLGRACLRYATEKDN